MSLSPNPPFAKRIRRDSQISSFVARPSPPRLRAQPSGRARTTARVALCAVTLARPSPSRAPRGRANAVHARIGNRVRRRIRRETLRISYPSQIAFAPVTDSRNDRGQAQPGESCDAWCAPVTDCLAPRYSAHAPHALSSAARSAALMFPSGTRSSPGNLGAGVPAFRVALVLLPTSHHPPELQRFNSAARSCPLTTPSPVMSPTTGLGIPHASRSTARSCASINPLRSKSPYAYSQSSG